MPSQSGLARVHPWQAIPGGMNAFIETYSIKSLFGVIWGFERDKSQLTVGFQKVLNIKVSVIQQKNFKAIAESQKIKKSLVRNMKLIAIIIIFLGQNSSMGSKQGTGWAGKGLIQNRF